MTKILYSGWAMGLTGEFKNKYTNRVGIADLEVVFPHNSTCYIIEGEHKFEVKIRDCAVFYVDMPLSDQRIIGLKEYLIEQDTLERREMEEKR